MNGKENINGEHPTDGDNRLPVVPPEIGPADYADLIDFNNDSDEDFDFADVEEVFNESDDEMQIVHMVPYQAVQFLVDVPQEQQIVEVAQPNDEVEACGNLPEAMMAVPIAEEVARAANVEANADENQQQIEVAAGIQNEPEDAELVEQVPESAGELMVGKDEEQEGNPAENRLHQVPAQHTDTQHRLVENQESNGRSSASDHDQESSGGRSNSSGDSIEEKVQMGELPVLEEAMEKLEMEAQPDIQNHPEVQEDAKDQIVDLLEVEEVESLGEEVVHQERNGEQSSGKLPEDQLEKIIPVFANEETLVPEPVPDPVEVQVEEHMEAGISAAFVPDEQDNLVEEIAHEEQAVPAHDPAGLIEARNNVIPESEPLEPLEVHFDPLMYMAYE